MKGNTDAISLSAQDAPPPTASHWLADHPDNRTDTKIRALGYRIHTRTEGHEPTWSKGGVVFGEADILRRHGIAADESRL